MLHGWTARWQHRLTSENSWVSGEVTPCSFTRKSSLSLQRPGDHLCVVIKHQYNPHSQLVGGGGGVSECPSVYELGAAWT